MKKILAVLIAISMVATMAFAADFTFEVKTSGDILNWSTGEKAATLITRNDNVFSTTLSAATDDGKAGTSMKITNTTDADYDNVYDHPTTLEVSDAAIWIKPVDGVKLTFGGADFNVGAVANFDADDDTGDEYGKTVKGDGFTVEYTGVEKLTVTAAIQKGVKTNKVPTIAGKVVYEAAEAATIAVTADVEKDFGVAVSGSVAPVSYVAAAEYLNGAIKVAEKATVDFAPVSVTEAVEYDVDAKALIALESLSVDLAPVTLSQNARYTADAISAGVKAEATVDVVTCSVEAKTADVKAIADNVTLEAVVKAELTGKVGSADWSITPKATVDILQDFSFAVEVPFSVKIAF